MGVVSRRWMWVESVGVASGCGCKEVYRFPHITYPYSSVLNSMEPYTVTDEFFLCRSNNCEIAITTSPRKNLTAMNSW